MADHPERLVERVGYRIGCAIADNPVLAPRLSRALADLPKAERERIVKEIERDLATAALDATFAGGPHG